MIVMKLSYPGSKLILIVLRILVCVITGWGHYNVDSDLSQNYFKCMYDKIIQEQLKLLRMVELLSNDSGDLVNDERVIHYICLIMG